MKKRLVLLVTVLGCIVGGVGAALAQHQHSPYTDSQSREVRALSRADIEALLRGDGMGLALAAELNRYAGPRHVLDLADRLGLSDAQREAVKGVFESMRTAAVHLGTQIVELERGLDREFRQRTINRDRLREATERIGLLHGRLREIHLGAHLAVAQLLSEEQQLTYERLRGHRGQ